MLDVELDALLKDNAQAFLQAHLEDDAKNFALKYHHLKSLPIRAIAEQISCTRKAKKKLSGFFKEGMIFTEQSIEQCSSQQTAVYKTNFMRGERAIDLTGGLGMDAACLASTFRSVTYVEQDALLAKIFQHNLKKSGKENVEIVNENSIQHLQTYPDGAFDWIYIDPSRRKDGRRLYALEDCAPNVIAHQALLMRKAVQVCIKASPLVDLTAVQRAFHAVKEIHVVSLEGECKEILIVLSRCASQKSPARLKAVILSRAKIQSHAEFSANANEHFEKSVTPEVNPFFYVPDVALTKANLTAKLAAEQDLHFINPAVDYLTADVLQEDFPGRTFRVERVFDFKKKGFRKQLVEAGYSAASIARRGFPHSPEELRRLLKLEESSERFLFFTKMASKKNICICCRKVS